MEQNYGNFTKNCSKTSRDAAQALHNYHYLMKYNPCIVWMHHLKFLGHWCDLNLPKSFTTHVCATFFCLERALQCVWYRVTKTTLQIVLLADWRFFETLINNDAPCGASQTLREIGHIRVHEGFDEETLAIKTNWTLLFLIIKHFADPFLHEDKLTQTVRQLRFAWLWCANYVRSIYSLVKDWFSVTYSLVSKYVGSESKWYSLHWKIA